MSTGPSVSASHLDDSTDTAAGDATLQPPSDGISAVVFSPDSSRLLVSSWDGVCISQSPQLFLFSLVPDHPTPPNRRITISASHVRRVLVMLTVPLT